MTENEYKYFEESWKEIQINDEIELNIASLYQYTVSKKDNKEYPTYLSCPIYPSHEGEFKCMYSTVKLFACIDDDTLCEYYDYCLYAKETGKYCGSTSILYPTVICKVLDIEKNGNIIYVQFNNDDEDEPVETAFTKDEFFAAASEYIHGGKDVIPTF